MAVERTSIEHPVVHQPAEQPGYRPLLAWTVLIVLVLFMVVNWADRTILALAAQPIMQEFGISASRFGLISSSFFLLFSVSTLVVGFLAARVSTKWVLLLLALLWACAQLPVFIFASAGMLLGTRLVLGAAEGPAAPMAVAVAHSWFPVERRGLASSWITSGASIAKIVVAPMLTLIIVGAGWRTAFLVLAIASLAWAGLWAAVGRDGPFTLSARSKSSTSADREIGRATVRRAVFNRTFLVLLLAAFPMYGLVTVVISWLPSYLEAGLGFTRVESGFLYGLPSLASLVFMLLGGAVTDRMLKRGGSSRVARGLVPAVAFAAGGLLIAMLPFLAAGNRIVAVGVLMVGYGLGNMAMPIVYAAIGSLVETTKRTTVLGIFFALHTFSGVIAPWVTGVLVDAAATRIEGYNHAFVIFGVLIVAGSILAGFMADPDRDRVRADA